MALTTSERNSVADAILDRANAIETGFTLRQAIRIMGAALAGILSGASGSTVNIQKLGGGTVRISATVDSSGNRTAVTLDGS